MPLNRRQKRAFTDIADLYPPEGLLLNEDREMLDRQPVPAPAYTNVECRVVEGLETLAATLAGRSNYDIADTKDKIRFAADQQIGDGWYVHIRNTGDWYVIQGIGKDRRDVRRRRPNARIVVAIKTSRPAGV